MPEVKEVKEVEEVKEKNCSLPRLPPALA